MALIAGMLQEAATGNLCLKAYHSKAGAGNPCELVPEVAGAQQGDPGCPGFRQITVMCQRVQHEGDRVPMLLRIHAYSALLGTSQNKMWMNSEKGAPLEEDVKTRSQHAKTVSYSETFCGFLFHPYSEADGAVGRIVPATFGIPAAVSKPSTR